MKLDAGIGGIESAAQRAADAEAAGYAGVFTAETGNDPFLPLLLAAEATERVDLVTAIAVAFARSPMTTAVTANDIHRSSNGRFILGLGSQIKPHIERRFSMPWSKPAARMREFISALHAIWGCWNEGTKLDFRGDFYTHTLMTPFFNPGPIEHPEIPIYIAGVNTRLARLAGELCEGFHVHPFHTPEYVRQIVKPAIKEGAEKENRHPEDIKLVTSVFVITGETEEEVEDQREKMRAQTAFYASTPSYRVVLEAHGWEDIGEELGKLARDKKWDEMPGLITDEMLRTFAVEAAPEEVGPALKERYEGLMDRVALYVPFVPGERDDFWRKMLEAVNGD